MEINSHILGRNNAFIALYAFSFDDDIEQVLQTLQDEEPSCALNAFGRGLVDLYIQNCDDIEAKIQDRLKGWRLERVSRVNLSVLRLAVAEMLYGAPGMDSVVINEAVELSKKYGDEKDYQFINGVLGSISRAEHPSDEPSATLAPDGEAPAEK